MPLYADGKFEIAKLVTEKFGDSFNVEFTAASADHSSVLVKLGGNAALIRREELAAAAALFPPQPCRAVVDMGSVVAAINDVQRSVEDLHSLTDQRSR